MTVLVLGATGNVGPHVVAALHDAGTTPNILVRDGARAHELLGDTARVITGDVTDAAALSEAMTDVDSVLLLSPHSYSMADLQLRVIREVRRTGARIVKVSGTSAAITPNGPHACRQHWEVERVLAESGQPFVILRPNSFMQVLIAKQMIPALQTTGVIPNPIADSGISFIDARDVGAVAARVLLGHEWDGQTLELTGPRSVTYADIAELVSGLLGKPVSTVETTPADVRATLIGRGMADWEADHFQEMYQLFRDGESEFVTTTVEDVTGTPARTIEAFLAEQLETASA